MVISSFSLCLPFWYLSLTVFFTRNYKQDLVFNMAIKRRNYNLKIYLVFRAKVSRHFLCSTCPRAGQWWTTVWPLMWWRFVSFPFETIFRLLATTTSLVVVVRCLKYNTLCTEVSEIKDNDDLYFSSLYHFTRDLVWWLRKVCVFSDYFSHYTIHLSRLQICQKIYTTHFSGKRILLIENK